MRRAVGVVAAVVALASAAVALPAAAQDEAFVAQEIRVPMTDGVELEVRLGGRGPLGP